MSRLKIRRWVGRVACKVILAYLMSILFLMEGSKRNNGASDA